MKQIIERIITGMFMGLAFWVVFIYLPPIILSTLIFGILLYILVAEWPLFFNIRSSQFWLITPLYPILPFLFVIAMNQHHLYRDLLFILMVIVSTHDTGAYVIGSMLGKRKIAPAISPGKTWEGFIGGYLCAAAGFAYLLFTRDISKPWWFILSFSLIICLLGVAGDLFESYLKRKAALKDSGRILPGHGGFLDRFDAILVTVLFFYFFKDFTLDLLK